MVPDTPPPATKHGRSRGRDTWRAQQKPAPGVGTRSRTRLAELEKRDNAQAQAAQARWPPSPDITEDIQTLTRELTICDVPRNTHRELERVFPSGEDDTEQTPRQPPAACLMTRHQDTYFIPPPSRAVGGVRGRSAPVSTATLGLIHRQDPALAAQLREDPGSLMTQQTRRRVYSTMRLIRTGRTYGCSETRGSIAESFPFVCRRGDFFRDAIYAKHTLVICIHGIIPLLY